ncbi:hypothetical protein ACP4OV_011947 [Aristida adscensionis]
MDPKAIQESASCEVDKALFPEIRNETTADVREVLWKMFNEKSTKQWDAQYVDVCVEMLCGDIEGEPSSNGAIAYLQDWYKVLEGDTDGPVLHPPVETNLNQPSEELLDNTASDQEDIQKPLFGSTKKQRGWTAQEHSQFLRGVKHYGRGQWKAISEEYVPSRTPRQIASHAQKFFIRMKNNEMEVIRRRFSINDIEPLGHDLYGIVPTGTEPWIERPAVSSIIPPPMASEDMDFMNDLAQAMPSFWPDSTIATNSSFGQMAPSNGTLGGMQWELPSIPLPRNQVSFLLDQTGRIGAEIGTYPSLERSLGTATNCRCKNNETGIPNVLTAPPEVLHPEHGGDFTNNFASQVAPTNQYNLNPGMPPF